MAEKTITDVSADLKAVKEAIEKPAATSAADVEAANEKARSDAANKSIFQGIYDTLQKGFGAATGGDKKQGGLIAGLLGGVGAGLGGIGKAVGKKIKSVAVNSKGNSRLSAAGKADSAEKKLGKANAKNADIKRGNKAKAKLGKLKKVKPEETEMSQEEFKKYVPDGTRMMSEQLINVRMWQEAAGGEKEDLDKSPENTAKKMKRAEEPKPNIATESVVAEGELPPALKKAIDAKKKKSGDEEETEEELSAKQKAIDLNKNGKVDGEDLAKLRKKGDKKEDVQEGGVKKAMMNDAESMDKDKFVKKYGKEMSDAAAQWDSMNEEMTIPQAQDFKVQSMKHALAKVWGMDDMSEGELPPALKKAIDAKKKGKEEAEEDMKGNKTETGKKAAVIEIEPQLDKKK